MKNLLFEQYGYYPKDLKDNAFDIDGWNFKRNAEDTTGIFFPASGYRDNSSGSLSGVGSRGLVWLSSASSQSYAHELYFTSGEVRPQQNNYRACGCSVRPVQE